MFAQIGSGSMDRVTRVTVVSGANMVVIRSVMSGGRALKMHARDSAWIHRFLIEFRDVWMKKSSRTECLLCSR